MSFRFRVKSYRKRLKLIISVLCLTVFFNEYFIYWYDSLRWPHVDCLKSQNGDCQKILIVSDPQILGFSKESWITCTDSDRYLKQSFYYAMHHVEPDVIIFLGDLMDEGSTSTDEEYEYYKLRFSKIFETLKFKPMIIYLPGDNDIGGEGVDHVTQNKIERFNKNFPSQVENFSGNIQFIVVNRIIGDFNLPQVSPNKDKNVVVLSHIPLTFIPGIFSREVMTKLKPNVVFSAHDHRMAIATTRLNDSQFFEADSFFHGPTKVQKHINSIDCVEVMWPTCSYRMGVDKIGYGFATIGVGDMEIGILWIHSRFWSLYLYLFALVSCLAIYCLPTC